MARQVLRYRSTRGTGPYAAATIQLVKLARETDAEFEFGPLGVDRMFREGLTVTGASMEDLEPVRRFLGTIEHLHQTGDWLE